ncbi:altronate dehydratase family protein [Heyndrickxia faecalis]|uniref:D-galactarate dehydratase/Altronate hydrolase domain protein n=1 Tax=Heyndrickxia coagulans 36D1 TaxID=345219 RepID=G2TP98_HEYCO|nr:MULTISPECIES: altronate dehydratase family protein [Heyndrickxia]AEP01422.1 D-galactarate dehydratase/Altronate hydrolase domain protein [Heyndrickxia coagulans 36D1]APB36938.1 altronate hydrolase [Heyndrickxia coagulans]KGT37295.1 altronate hydrolase [Heyndrickxia coagulans P38]MED4320606.1 altronate dehydratase family protein [Weizmannia sp. CD-2023]MED4867600.1 altronate dehydratase family protein [Weizmannia sp. CD-2023]
MKNKTIQLNPRDNVLVALQDLEPGDVLTSGDRAITVNEAIKRGHKIALEDIEENADIIKYGSPIGHATKKIEQGSWVHTHNVSTNLSGKVEYEYKPELHPRIFPKDSRTFKGYLRKNGKAGIRNDLYIIPTVGCINMIGDLLVDQFKANHPDNGAFDEIILFKHPYGCSQLGDDLQNTRKILMDAAAHPNAGGVLIFGLGCENNQLDEMKAQMGEFDEKRVKFMICQDVEDEVETGFQLLEELNEAAKEDKRIDLPLSELKIGLKCGGSDGFSGITGNPLLGRFSDFVISQGGSTVLTEVPEMFGAEKMLMARAKDEIVFNKIVKLINQFKDYFASYGQPIYENPSPGNKAGGITTLEDKSLGCTQKAGTSAVVDVLEYGEKLKEKGLSLLQAPGNDLVSSTALAAADCQMVLFTTGRGTPFGTFVPTVKVSTNTELYEKKKQWIDFNAGRLLDEEMDEVVEQFISFILEVASGKKTKNEIRHLHEIAIFKNGVTE